jgi:WXG100 family type VII secretion target
MDTLTVRTADIGTLVTRLNEQAKSIHEQLEELRDAAALFRQDWEGESAEAFDARYKELSIELKTHEVKLQYAARLAHTLQKTYEGADVKLARLFGEA